MLVRLSSKTVADVPVTSESDREAIESQESLRTLIEQVLVQNNDLSRRLNDMELRSLRCDHTSTFQASIADLDGVRRVSGAQRSSTQSFEEEGRRILAFEATLDESRVYRRAGRNECDISFRTSVAPSHAWSQLSGISLAQLSSISVIALPIVPTDIVNAQWYMPKQSRAVSSTPNRSASDPLSDQSSAHTKLPIRLSPFKRKPEINNVEGIDRFISFHGPSKGQAAERSDIDRSQISLPIEFLGSTNDQAYEAPDIFCPDRPKSSPYALSSGSSLRAADEFDHIGSAVQSTYNDVVLRDNVSEEPSEWIETWQVSS